MSILGDKPSQRRAQHRGDRGRQSFPDLHESLVTGIPDIQARQCLASPEEVGPMELSGLGVPLALEELAPRIGGGTAEMVDFLPSEFVGVVFHFILLI